MKAQEVMRQYLARVGQLPGAAEAPDTAGPGSRRPTEEDVQVLRSTIHSQAQMNRVALIVALCLICATFVAAVIVSALNHDSLKIVMSVTGIGSASQVGLFAWLRLLWRDSNVYSVLLIAAGRLSPEELVKLVAGLYFGNKNISAGQGLKKTKVNIKGKQTTA